jgi:hypothetical protein
MKKNNIVIGIVVAMAVGVVITGSTLTAVSAQGNMTAGGGDIVKQLKAASAKAQLINNKKIFLIACDPSMTDPNTQCVVHDIQVQR